MIDASVDPIGAIKELQGDVSRGKLQLLRDEIETCRQWFESDNVTILLESVVAVQNVGYTVVAMTLGGPIVFCCEDTDAASGVYRALIKAWKEHQEAVR